MPGTKLLPLIVSVTLEAPATTLAGLTREIAGPLTVKATAFDGVPPSETVICGVPLLVSCVLVTAALSWVALR